MNVIDKDVTVCFDIDKTLIFWKPQGEEESEFSYKVDYYGEDISITFHEEHAQLLRANLARGRNVVIWSGNGYKWVKNVIEKMVEIGIIKDTTGITIMSKPSMYVDDMSCETWMGNRVYIDPHSNPYAEDKN